MIITFKTFKMKLPIQMIQLYTANFPKHFYTIFFNALCCRTAKKQCNFRFTVIFIMPRRGVKNHLSFTSKNCKVKIHDLLSWAMILHAFCKRTKAMEAQKNT